jgi:transcriptional regulator with XRE-family HTH domain
MTGTTIGQRIRSEREKHKISVRKFAHNLGISHQWLCRIELGQVDVSSQRLQQIARELGVSPGSLFPRHPKTPSKHEHEVALITNGHKEEGIG